MAFYPSGLGGSTGADIATDGQVISSRNVVFVHHSGTTGNDGLTRGRPINSLGNAFATAGAIGQVYCVLSGHTDSSVLTTSFDGMTIVGEGEGASRPRMIGGSLAISKNGFMLDSIVFGSVSVLTGSTAHGAIVRNCSFLAETGKDAVSFSTATHTYVQFSGCEFGCSTAANNGWVLYHNDLGSGNGMVDVDSSTVPVDDATLCPTGGAPSAVLKGASVKVNNLALDSSAGLSVSATNSQIADSSSQRGSWVSA